MLCGTFCPGPSSWPQPPLPQPSVSSVFRLPSEGTLKPSCSDPSSKKPLSLLKPQMLLS